RRRSARRFRHRGRTRQDSRQGPPAEKADVSGRLWGRSLAPHGREARRRGPSGAGGLRRTSATPERNRALPHHPGDLMDYQYISHIESPADLKKVPRQELPKVAAECRDYLISVVSKIGGHLASSLGA